MYLNNKRRLILTVLLIVVVMTMVYHASYVKADQVCCYNNQGDGCYMTDSSSCSSQSSQSLQSPTSCDNVDPCQKVCCLGSNGQYIPDTPKAKCENEGGAVISGASDCSGQPGYYNELKCCVAGTQPILTQSKSYCDYLNGNFFSNINSYEVCSDKIQELAVSGQGGCCINHGCSYVLSGDECDGIFKQGKYCSDPSLRAKCNCQHNAYTDCVDFDPNVHNFDSCGNPEGINQTCNYPSKVCSNDGTEASCVPGSCSLTNVSSWNDSGKWYYYNKSFDLNTFDKPKNISSSGNIKSICLYDNNYTQPGTESYVLRCVRGKPKVEPCDEARASVCLYDESQGKAKCIENPGEGCFDAYNRNECEQKKGCKYVFPQIDQGFINMAQTSYVWSSYKINTDTWGSPPINYKDFITERDPNKYKGQSYWTGDPSNSIPSSAEEIAGFRKQDNQPQCIPEVNLGNRSDLCEESSYVSHSRIRSPAFWGRWACGLGECETGSTETEKGGSPSQWGPGKVREILWLYSMIHRCENISDCKVDHVIKRDYSLKKWGLDKPCDTEIRTEDKYDFDSINKIKNLQNYEMIEDEPPSADYDAFCLEYDFKCLPWQPPVKISDEDCKKCQADSLRPCTEYKCKSIGANCEFKVLGTGEGYCYATGEDFNAPVIDSVDVVLPKSKVGVNLDTTNKKIQVYEDNGSLTSHQIVKLKLTLDEPADCKIDKYFKDYDSMSYNLDNVEFTDTGFSKEHTLRIVPLVYGDQTIFTYYIRCQDVNGNTNEVAYTLNYSVKEQDIAPPYVINTIPSQNSYVSQSIQLVNITLIINEPANCSYNLTDMGYADMVKHNTIDCSKGYYTGVGYSCKFENIKLSQADTTNIFFKCNDTSGNVMQNSYVLTLRKAPPLYITYAWPNDTTVSVGPQLEVEVKATTEGGLSNGEAVCYYGTGSFDEASMFDTTQSSQHQTIVSFINGGDQTLDIWCCDAQAEANCDHKLISFTLKKDIEGPKIKAVYQQSGQLVVETDEKAECHYTTDLSVGCSFNYDAGDVMSSTEGISHSTNLVDKTYYVKCEDVYGNLGECNEIKPF